MQHKIKNLNKIGSFRGNLTLNAIKNPRIYKNIFFYKQIGEKMTKLKSIVAVVAGLFAFTSVQAGEMTVTGSMQATYQSEVDAVTGNPLGMNTDLTFTGTTETDFGTATWTMGTDGTFLGDSGADHKLKLATGLGTFKVGNSGDSANDVDDITPSAFEEANGSGSGTYSNDVGAGMEASMSLGYNNADILGTGISVDYTYYPKLDGKLNNEKGSSTTENDAKGDAESINVGIPLSAIPYVGDTPIGGAKITLGYNVNDNLDSTAQSLEGGTVAVVAPLGPLKVGYQKKAYAPVQTDGTKEFYKDDVWGIAYAVNDELALSYNVYESDKHLETSIVSQETKAINIAYTVGGLTLAFQDASTSNAAYSSGTDDDTRTLSIKTAF